MKDIPGYEGLYAANEEGGIWCYPREWNAKIGKREFTHKRKGKFLKGYVTYNGYRLVNLVKEHRYQTFSVHRLIAKTLIENPENLPQVNHKNGIKTDNRVENLEWITARENIAHGIKEGFIKPFEGSRVILTPEIVRTIKEEVKKRGDSAIVAKKYGVSRSTVSMIIRGKTWKHIK